MNLNKATTVIGSLTILQVIAKTITVLCLATMLITWILQPNPMKDLGNLVGEFKKGMEEVKLK